MIWTRRFSISVPTLDGHSPLSDITNTYDSQKQCNPLGSNILGRGIIMILFQLNQSTMIAADARPVLVWHQFPLTMAGGKLLSMQLILSVESRYTAKYSWTRSLGSGFSTMLLKLT